MVIGIDASRAEAKNKTGVERYSFEIIRALRQARPADAEVVLYSREPLPPELGPFGEKWKNRVLNWPPRYFWTALRLSWEMLRRPPDVLFVPGYRLPPFAPKRSVVTVHDATFLEYPQLYDPAERAIQKKALADNCRRAAAIIVPSVFAKEQLAARRPPRLAVVPLGVSAPPDREKGEGGGRKFFLAVGRVDKKKNLEVAIDGFSAFAAKHPDHELVIVGRPSFGFGEIKARAEKSSAARKIEFTGVLPDAQMFALMRDAVALVHPCPVEGFGLPVVEAMALGTPVIAANAGAAAEAAGDAALLVPPTESGRWAEAMEQITFDIFREPLVAKGLVRAKEFSWKKAAVETWEVLLGLTGAKSRD